MIYEKHNFGGNYSSANGVKDFNSLQDILLNRLVDAILKDKQKFINALNAVGVKASDNLSNQEVLKLVIKNSAALKDVSNYSNGDGFSFDLSGVGAIGSGIGALTTGIDALINPNKQLNIEQEKTKQIQLQLQAAQIMASKGGGVLGLSRGAWIGIGVGAVLLITIIVIATRKK